MRHHSTSEMIQQLVGMLGTTDLSDWEQGFVTTLVRYVDAGKVTELTDKQVEALDQLYSRYFA
ncbi:hypothetical protein HDG34_005832 [Paraburkholderia sp. HC6.4b]|uniref:hypothetical protein n=1 Tax=unclassified Paraburkholderia TaxID=2615204 RepID=UPI00161993BA|nr:MULTISPECIES: hypothetical protein [unclassified Paraburkholderia]MBB5411866.1 hypothetical protein [Paraburkholderia sp. HC6.4b]MBB5450178.1 hypothetical protein [Paraburkholderia sp. Kb1A]